jgi:rRNA maturation protein Rpf1
MRTFCRDLSNSIPDVVRVNRGKMSLDEVAERAIELEADRVVLVERWRGGPGRISLFHVSATGVMAVPPLMLISGVRLRREFKEGPRRAHSSVVTVEPNNSSELEMVAGKVSNYFGLPMAPLDEATESHSVSMHFSFDSSRRLKITFMLLGRMFEIGPRVTLSKLVWEVSS